MSPKRVNTPPIYRNASGKYFTKKLFWEMCNNDGERENVLYTLKRSPHEGYKSLFEEYMRIGDPTEYTFAQECFEGWEHWKILCETTWFKPYIDAWREELQVMIQSKGLMRIKEEALNPDSRNSYQAAKLLLDRGWADKETKQRITRTAKDKIKREAARMSEEALELNEDAARLNVEIN